MALKKIGNVGTPSVVTTGLTGERLTAAQALVSVSPPSASFNSIVNDLLTGLNEEAVIVVDTKNRKVYSATTNKDDLAGIMANRVVVADKNTVLTPVAGQSGTSLEFDKADGANASDEIKTVSALIADAAKPKRSLSNVLSTILAQSFTEGKEPVIVIDQTAKTITVMPSDNTMGDAIVTDIAAAKVANKEIIEVDLSGDSTDVTNPVTKLAFEGGDV